MPGNLGLNGAEHSTKTTNQLFRQFSKRIPVAGVFSSGFRALGYFEDHSSIFRAEMIDTFRNDILELATIFSLSTNSLSTNMLNNMRAQSRRQ